MGDCRQGDIGYVHGTMVEVTHEHGACCGSINGCLRSHGRLTEGTRALIRQDRAGAAATGPPTPPHTPVVLHHPGSE